MGVKGLPAYIRKWCENIYVQVPAARFKNRYCVIDANAYTHRFAAVSQTCQQYLVKFLGLIYNLKLDGVYPVFIFDGGAPDEKWEEQQKRRESQEAIRAEIARLEREDDDYGTNQERIAQLSKRLTGTPPEYKQALNELLVTLGVPVIRAPDEAERLCAALVKERKAALVLSPDSDLWVYDIDIVATDYNPLAHEFSIVSPSNIIKTVGLTREQWVDFCIMCGCDYNQNIPGIGPAKSFDLIKKHGSIEALPKNLNTDVLRHVRCRELYTIEPSGLKKISNGKLSKDSLTVMKRWGVEDHHPKMLEVFK